MTGRGFSLIEVTIVLAISVVMIGVVAGVYAQRRNVTNNDAAQQVASMVQNVRNEAQKGLGPTNGAVFASGETLFGEGMEFRNNCMASKACLRVYKLKEGVDSKGLPNNAVIVYETYDVATPQDFQFGLVTTGSTSCTTQYVSCYSKPPSATNFALLSQPLSTGGLNLGGLAANLLVVVRNGSGDMYAFRKTTDQLCAFNNTCASLTNGQQIGPDADNKANYTLNRRGQLRLVTAQVDTDVNLQSTWDNAASKYYVNIDLSGTNVITVTQP